MNNMAIQSPLAELFSQYNNPLADFRSSTYVREQSFRSRESFATDLVLQTKEGDQVTLRSNSFSQLDAFTYDSRAILQTESEITVASQSQREITLASGESFSFTVEGELNEAELEDIEAIVKGLDGVMSEMSQGDTAGALDKVMEMENFRSVSAFAADITYQRSYEIRTEVASTVTSTAPVQESVPGKKNGQFFDFNTIFKKLENQLLIHGNKLLSNAQGPINKLFKHHLHALGKENEGNNPIYSALESVMEDITSMIEEIAGNFFNEQLSAVQDEVQ